MIPQDEVTESDRTRARRDGQKGAIQPRNGSRSGGRRTATTTASTDVPATGVVLGAAGTQEFAGAIAACPNRDETTRS